MLRKNFKVELSVAVIATLLLCNSLLAFSPVTISKVSAQEGYTYYGYIPAKIYRYNLTIGNDPNSGWRLAANATTKVLIAVVGMKDNTHVKIYDQSNDTLVSDTTLNSMQKHYVLLPNGTFFKVETSKMACVMLINYANWTRLINNNETMSPAPATFYQSTNGAYVGKEFYLISSQTHGNVQYSIQYAIFALEKSTVTVTREDGDEHQYVIDANGWKELMFDCFKAYKIVSTGNIMIQSGRPPDIWGYARTFYVPATVGGGFVGETFYSWSTTSWDWTENYGFRVSATQDTKVKVYSLETKQQILTANVVGGSGWGFKPQAPAFVVQSDHPVLLEYMHNGSLANANGQNGTYDAYGSGVGFFGVKPNEDTPFWLSAPDSYVEAYIFASEDTEITIDDYTYSIKADSYHLLTQPGTHVIRSNKNVVVETLNWPNTPEYQGLQTWDGTQVLCVQTVGSVTDVTLAPLESFPLLYVIIGAAVAAIAVIVAFLFMRGRGRK